MCGLEHVQCAGHWLTHMCCLLQLGTQLEPSLHYKNLVSRGRLRTRGRGEKEAKLPSSAAGERGWRWDSQQLHFLHLRIKKTASLAEPSIRKSIAECSTQVLRYKECKINHWSGKQRRLMDSKAQKSHWYPKSFQSREFRQCGLSALLHQMDQSAKTFIMKRTLHLCLYDQKP